jgi:hypothetical protein
MEFVYNTGCKIEFKPMVEGTYTAWLISGPGGQPISDPATLQADARFHEFTTAWQQK